MATTSFNDTAAAGQARKPAHVAYACAAMGWAAFPLAPGTKRPAITGWQQRATTSLDALAYMWSGEFQDCSVGIATGRASNLFVVDLDRKPGVDGFKSMHELMHEHGASMNDFTNTIIVATPSGGCHIYLAWPEGGGIKNSSGELGEGIDVRGEGGLVHAAGLDSYQIVPRDGVRRLDIMEAPDWLVELCRKQPREEPFSARDQDAEGRGMRVVGTHRTLQALNEAPHGSRNVELNRAAFRLGVRGEMTREDAWRSCYGILVDMGAGDGEADWRRTFESGWRSGLAKRHDSMNTQLPSAAGPSATTEG